jgi:hypothetical protein
MLSTKTRTTILALVASASFAATTVAPAVSQARPKTTTIKRVTQRQACNEFVESIRQAEEAAKEYEKAGDTANAEAAWGMANAYFDNWQGNGCQILAIVTSPPAVLVAPGHVLKSAS